MGSEFEGGVNRRHFLAAAATTAAAVSASGSVANRPSVAVMV